jgi:adenylate cyclase class IV
MGYQNREIEIKLLVQKAKSLAEVNNLLGRHFKAKSKSVIRETSKDTYWDSPKSSKADFARLRYYPQGLAQMTIKHTDKGDNLDRVEVDLEVGDPDKAMLILTALLGKPKGSIVKEYVVYFLDENETTISLYQIVNDSRIFVEVEAKTEKKVFALIKEITKVLSHYKLKRETKSLYQIFLAKK